MPEFPVRGPFDERNLHDDFRANPMCAFARKSNELRERPVRGLERVELPSQIQEHPGVEAGSNFAGKGEFVTLVITDEQCAESDARAVRIGEATDEEVL